MVKILIMDHVKSFLFMLLLICVGLERDIMGRICELNVAPDFVSLSQLNLDYGKEGKASSP